MVLLSSAKQKYCKSSVSYISIPNLAVAVERPTDYITEHR